LYLIVGGAGSGKTVYLLSGLEKGLKLFATETVHLQIVENKVTWYMGSLVDNVRLGTLVHDFPLFLPPGCGHDPRSQWQEKMAIDLSPFCAKKDSLQNPRNVSFLFPRIEKGFERPVWIPVENRQKAEKFLFDNITQKLAETTLLYDRLAVMGLDRKDLAESRFQAVKELLGHPTISEITTVLASPQECWGDTLQ
jgi:hypothetical protein